MNRTRILTSVSVAALMTTTIAPAARADNVVFDLTAAPPTLVMATKSASVEALSQINKATKLTADTATALLGIPDKNGGPIDLLGGLSDSLLVDKNTVFADAISNTAANIIDLVTATGSGDTSAATIGVLQITSSAGTAGLSGTVKDSSIRINAQDIGAGGAATQTDNMIEASATGNLSHSGISGDINPLLTSSEVGTSKAQSGSPTLDADATMLVATVQSLSDIDAPLAGVSGSRIGIQATSDGVSTKQLDGVPLTETGNQINATMVGNDATGIIFIDNDKALTLAGSAGVATLQYADGTDALTSKIGTSRIEVGDSGVTPTADLLGSDVTFSLNTINADATANSAANTLVLAEGVSVAGISAQANTATIGVVSKVGGDLYIQNTQTSLVSTSSSNQSDMSVLVQDMTGSAVLAGDGDLKDKSGIGNRFGASATGNDATNLIQTGDAAGFKGFTAINTGQDTSAKNDASLAATLAVSAGTIKSDGVVGTSAVTASSNSFSAEGTGNRQDSLTSIDATNIHGNTALYTTGRVVINNTLVHDDLAMSDLSVLSMQALDGTGTSGVASATAAATSLIVVDVVNQGGKAGTSLTASAIDVSGNSQTATATGNLSTRHGMELDAGATFAASVGVINDQTVENLASIQATSSTSSAAHYVVNVAPALITGSPVTLSGNEVTSSAYGNLAQDTSFTISGVYVRDNDNGAGPYNEAFGTVNHSNGAVPSVSASGGIMLLSGQLATDIGTVSASTSGTGVAVSVGAASGTTTFDKSNVTVSGNTILTQATINQTTSTGTVTATTLQTPSDLVNAQTLGDADKDGKGGGVSAQTSGAVMTTTVATNGAAITNSRIAMTDNSAISRGAVNVADNSLDVTAQSAVILNAAASNSSNTTSVILDVSDIARSGNAVVNDQYLDGLNTFSVAITSGYFPVTLNTGAGGLTDVDVDLDRNMRLAYGAGNDATNIVTLDVQTFDLSLADTVGGPLNGPIATVISNQRALDVPNTGAALSTSIGDLTWLNASGVKGAITNSHLSVDGNSDTAFSRVNNVSNTLTATGTAFVAPTSAKSTAILDSPSDGDIRLKFTSFASASRQENALDVSAKASSTFVWLHSAASSVTGSTLTVDNNLVNAEAYGNDSQNVLTLDYGVNQAQGFIANQQASTDADPTLTVNNGGTLIQLTNDKGPATATSFSMSGNHMLGIAGTNQTDNLLTSKGTDVTGGSGIAPLITLDTTTGEMIGKADLGVFNAQGGVTTADTATDTISVNMGVTFLSGAFGAINSGSLAIDNNLMLAQGIIHSASNGLDIDAKAVVGSLGAIVASQQIVTTGSKISVTGDTNGVSSTIASLSNAGAVSVDVSGNQIGRLAIGGTATNTLDVKAGASLTGSVAAPTPSIGATSLALNADFDIANEQLSKASSIVASTGGNFISVIDAAGMNGDSLKVDNNLIQSQAFGFVSENVIRLAAASSDATASVANHQLIDGTAISSSAGGSIYGMTKQAAGSTIEVSGNKILTNTVANTAVNGLVTSGKATLQESNGAGATINPAGTPVSVTGAAYTVLNWQETAAGTSLTSTVSGQYIGADFASNGTGVNDSSVAVSGNMAQAQAVANDATNVLVLNSGTFQHPSAAIASLQTTSDTTVSATVSGVSIGIGLTSLINASSNNSSFSVTGNAVGASAIGNSGVNIIRSQ